MKGRAEGGVGSVLSKDPIVGLDPRTLGSTGGQLLESRPLCLVMAWEAAQHPGTIHEMDVPALGRCPLLFPVPTQGQPERTKHKGCPMSA